MVGGMWTRRTRRTMTPCLCVYCGYHTSCFQVPLQRSVSTSTILNHFLLHWLSSGFEGPWHPHTNPENCQGNPCDAPLVMDLVKSEESPSIRWDNSKSCSCHPH